MAIAPEPTRERRVLLVDLDWRDADLLSELFQQPGVSVRLVVGEGPQDPGLRMAELGGLPRSLDLADLTREIFDVALVGERSSRAHPAREPARGARHTLHHARGVPARARW